MQRFMPVFEVYHFQFFMGTVSAVSYKQARERARKRWPNRRLQVEVTNVKLSDKEKIQQARAHQAKAIMR